MPIRQYDQADTDRATPRVVEISDYGDRSSKNPADPLPPTS
jgi:hypothetical protein